ncbi:magnesium transporter MgtE N-terminal domain-containing protein [Corynebacterium heidelbergense]|uniref:Magnesium transporter n=1 Tax=Corynebacterium heidelbergense TaxID=2055947 RepID=A0A364VDW8_9CORY|nr:CBS domain-containing protein [Corynebacterium heidelbergense]RAV34852.1 magnesium transporter [Corynebacterium heidelbergense]WCZ36933.1 Magnesium transporter MgtE [Corynebacterium heidelbergense]
MSETRVYAGRLAGMVVLGPDGDSVGRVRDVVVHIQRTSAEALGLVVELPSKRQIFLPMLRIATIDPREVTMVSSSVNLRPFRSRSGELTIMDDLVGAKVHTDDPEHDHLHGKVVEILDVELNQARTRDWMVSRVAVAERTRLGRRGGVVSIPFAHIQGVHASGTGVSDPDAELISSFHEMRLADIAAALADLPEDRRHKVAAELDDEMLAGVLPEMSEELQTGILNHVDIERAADVLEAMDPDDAADVLAEMPDDTSRVLLDLMHPEDSEPVRRLLNFSPDTVGALMTPEPIILTPQTTVAEALAHARNPEVPMSLSCLIFVVRPPQATPTGKYLGCVHLQKLLREPPSTLIGGILDLDLPALYAEDSHETAARYFATYNLVCGPVLDRDKHLLGAVAVDDLIDHMLPEDWREEDWRTEEGA